MKPGTTYRIRYVRPWEDTVREGTFTFKGEVISPNSAVVIMDPEGRERKRDNVTLAVIAVIIAMGIMR